MKQMIGYHHTTAMTSDVQVNHDFLTQVLGMKFVKKSVNQDDIYTYHTYYGDDTGAPGTAMTFFDFPNSAPGKYGTNMVTTVGLRVPNDAALAYYEQRFTDLDVPHEAITTEFGRQILRFEDPSGQHYQLLSDEHNEGMAAGHAQANGPVPAEYAVNGLGAVEIRINYFAKFKSALEAVFGFEEIAQEDNKHLFTVGEGGSGAQLIVIDDAPDAPTSVPGDGQVHHIAFRVADRAALNQWMARLEAFGLHHSGYVDRFYFESVYVRVGHILFELATDAPGFMADETYEELGTTLSLPDFMEPQRAQIEAVIKPFDTTGGQ